MHHSFFFKNQLQSCLLLNIKTDTTTGASGKLAILVLDGQNSVPNTANIKDMIKTRRFIAFSLVLGQVRDSLLLSK